MGKLAGRIALVTGASRGFGRATAILFAEEGADVVVGYRAAETAAREVAQEIERLGRRALLAQADLTAPNQVVAMADRALETFGRVDILVNNAAINEIVPFLEQDPANWRTIIDTNCFGMMTLTRQILPGMIERRYGRIVNVASLSGHVGTPNMVVYSGTKGFIQAFTKSLASEFGPYGITVNAVCPASVPTDMNVRLYTPEYRVKKAAELPVRHLGDPRDIAYAVLYAASGDAAFMTGQCVDVNGGALMR